MKILAIESCCVVASCAICEDDFVLASSKIATGLTHSQTLMVLVDDMFKTSKIDKSEIDAVAVSIGPGSFTGLRIGMALAKGIAMGLKKPLIGVETLKALSYNLLGVDGFICPCLDARRDTVYTALFESKDLVFRRVLDDFVEEIVNLKEILKEKQGRIFLVGDAAKDCYLKFKDLDNIFLGPPSLRYPDACSIGFLGVEQFRKGEVKKEVLPKYLRLSQAERQRKEKLNSKEEKEQ